MANHHTRHNPPGQDTLFATPASLMLDARLTPLERNGWQVLRMLRSAEGISPLANLGQLRRYLTTTPLGQRAGYETAWRVLIVLRLTGWISLVGQHRDPLTGHVLSELYQVHESALDFQRACVLDASLPALLQASIGHENNQVDRVAIHTQATLAQAPKAASIAAHDQSRDDDDLRPPPPQASEAANPLPLSGDSAGSTLVPQQTGHARHMTAEQGGTYKTYMYKKERTYRAREGDGDPASQSVSLPPCLSNAQADQQKDVQAALRRLPPSGLPAGIKTDASFEAPVSPEHHALALTGSRLGELAPTLTTEFQDNAVRRFAWRPEDGRLDLHPAAALPAQP